MLERNAFIVTVYRIFAVLINYFNYKDFHVLVHAIDNYHLYLFLIS